MSICFLYGKKKFTSVLNVTCQNFTFKSRNLDDWWISLNLVIEICNSFLLIIMLTFLCEPTRQWFPCCKYYIINSTIYLRSLIITLISTVYLSLPVCYNLSLRIVFTLQSVMGWKVTKVIPLHITVHVKSLYMLWNVQ